MAATRELTFKDKLVLRVVNPLKGVLKEIWGMTTGKIALLLLSILIAVSVSAALTMPPGFLDSWQSASFWEDNPVIVPPDWVKYFGAKVAPSIVEEKSKPDVTPQWDPSTGILTLTYRFEYTLTDPVFPQDYYFAVYGIKSYDNITPIITISVERPDGVTSVLWQENIFINNTNADVTSIYKTDPKKIKMDDLVSEIFAKYNITVPPNIIGENYMIQAISSSLLRDRVVSKISQPSTALSIFQKPVNVENWVTVLRSEQRPVLEEINNLLKNIRGSISNDPANILPLINNAISNVTFLINNLDKITFSDLYETLQNVSTLLNNAYKLAMSENYPSVVVTNINDAKSRIDKYLDSLKVTVSFIGISPEFEILTGAYRFEVNITYPGVRTYPSNPQSLISYVKFTVKGSVKGTLGTINNGADLATLLYYGFPIALLIGLIASVSSTLIGVIAGIISGYYGGWIDEVIQRIIDILNNIPFLPLMIIIGTAAMKVLPPGTQKSFYIIMLYVAILIIFSWAGLAIVVRSMTLSIKEEPYIEAAKAMGASNTRIIFYHIFPQVMMYAVATLVYNVPSAILTEAGLSVLGLRHGWPTWGAVLAEARAAGPVGYAAWWWILPPGLLLSLTSLTFVLLGLAVEKIVEPRLRTL
ncbi:MAG: ABC transporter permease [Desulfurococcus sp.]|uniref:ABC transporter permease n=1 Tax=Desulfurococcus sp. TaxID=51678 RepID=UPI003D101D85